MTMLQPVIALVLIGLACCHGGQNETKPGKNPSSLLEGQIIGGFPVPAPAFWAVMLRKDGQLKCGGSLIGKNWVLTTATCVKDAGEYSVRLASVEKTDFESGRVEMHIPQGNIFIKPEFTTEGHDIALIKLPVALMLPVTRDGEIFIDAIALPNADDVNNDHADPENPEFVGVLGWGRDKSADVSSTSPTLMFTSVGVITKAICANSFTDLKSWETCASGFDPSAPSQSCDFDNGGSVFAGNSNENTYMLGIISRHYDSTCVSGPEVFVRVAFFLDWIQQVTGISI